MHSLPRNERKSERGSALLLLTVMIAFAVIPMVGLAVDGGMAYLVQTRLSAACDAAALAGARSLSTGTDLASQLSFANATITSYLQSNFPAGLYRTSNLVVTSNIQETSYKTRTVSVNAVITMPTLFLGIVNQPTATIAASSQSTRRDVNIMLVLDRSGSIEQAGVCGTVRASAQTFADKFTNGRDRLGLVTFTIVPALDYAPIMNFKSDSPSLDSVLAQLKCGGNTGSAQALWMAYTQLQAINEPGALNLIVFFTDGVPNGLTATFPVKQLSDAGTRYGVSNPSSLASIPASPCKASGLLGAIAEGSGGTPLGWTTGVFDIAPVPIWDISNALVSAPGCSFFTSSDETKMRADIAYIPAVDMNGNATTGYKQVGTYPSGPYAGLIRVDTPQAVTAASQNAADNAARRIRGDKTLVPVIYSIGLGGTTSQPLDQDFLRRVANDPSSPVFDPSVPAGLFVYANNATQLSNAFNLVASQILRLSR